MNPQDKEQESDEIINEFWNEMEQLDCPFSYTMNELIVKVYQQAKQEERERIIGIIDKELSFLNDFSFKNKSDKELWYVRKSVYQYLKIKINSEAKRENGN